MRSIQTNTMIFMSDRLSVAFSFSRRAHLLTTCKAGGSIPPVGRARALFTKRLSAAFPEGAGNVASEHSLCSRLYILHYQQNDEVAYCHPIPPPACVNLPPAAWHRYRGGTICSTPAGGTSYLTTYLLQSSTEEGLLRFTVALQKGR